MVAIKRKWWLYTSDYYLQSFIDIVYQFSILCSSPISSFCFETISKGITATLQNLSPFIMGRGNNSIIAAEERTTVDAHEGNFSLTENWYQFVTPSFPKTSRLTPSFGNRRQRQTVPTALDRLNNRSGSTDTTFESNRGLYYVSVRLTSY